MNINELGKRVERGEKFRLGSKDIAMLNTMNTSKVKRGFLRTWLSDNWLEILTGIFIIVGICVIALIFIDALPDPVM